MNIKGIDLSTNTEPSDTMPPEIRDYFKQKAKKSMIISLLGICVFLIPFLGMLSSSGIIIRSFADINKDIKWKELFSDPEFLETLFSVEVILPIALIALILLIFVITYIRLFFSVISTLIKLNTDQFTWRTGEVTDMRYVRRKNRSSRRVYVDEERCSPLSAVDYTAMSLGDTAVVVYIRSLDRIKHRFAFKYDVESIPDNMLVAIKQEINKINDAE